MDKKFTIEHQYQLYLQRVNLEESKMHPLQKKQLKQAFFGAFGQLLILMRDGIAILPEDVGIKILDAQMKEVLDFFNAETAAAYKDVKTKGAC